MKSLKGYKKLDEGLTEDGLQDFKDWITWGEGPSDLDYEVVKKNYTYEIWIPPEDFEWFVPIYSEWLWNK